MVAVQRLANLVSGTVTNCGSLPWSISRGWEAANMISESIMMELIRFEHRECEVQV